MRRAPNNTTLALLLALILAAAPALAFAASATATPAPPASGAGSPAADVDIQLWPSEADGSSVIVSAGVPEDAKLPYTLRLPMPTGIVVTWAGEISGGGTSQDKEVAYTLEDGRGGKVLVMTLTTSRVAQYEGTLPSPTQVDGRSETTLEWIQSAPAGAEDFAVKLTNTAGEPTFDPAPVGAPQQNASGERLYSFAQQKLAIGSAYKLKVSWKTVAPGTATPGPSTSSAAGSSDVVLIVLVGALAVAVIALIVVAGRANRPATEAVDDVAAPPSPRRGAGARRGESSPDDGKADVPLSDDPFDDVD